jgi:uncharacterized membrane protein
MAADFAFPAMSGSKHLDRLHLLLVATLTALIALCVAWELWLAPLRPAGSWLVLKALPLLAPLFGVLHRRLYTLRWSAMLVILYFIEGTMRAYADSGLSARLAAAEVALALIFLVAAIAFIRRDAALRTPPSPSPRSP